MTVLSDRRSVESVKGCIGTAVIGIVTSHEHLGWMVVRPRPRRAGGEQLLPAHGKVPRSAKCVIMRVVEIQQSFEISDVIEKFQVPIYLGLRHLLHAVNADKEIVLVSIETVEVPGWDHIALVCGQVKRVTIEKSANGSVRASFPQVLRCIAQAAWDRVQ